MVKSNNIVSRRTYERVDQGESNCGRGIARCACTSGVISWDLILEEVTCKSFGVMEENSLYSYSNKLFQRSKRYKNKRLILKSSCHHFFTIIIKWIYDALQEKWHTDEKVSKRCIAN